MRSIQAGPLLLAAIALACGNAPIHKGGTNRPGVLSYAQVQTLKVGTPVQEILRDFGPPHDKLESRGKLGAIGYRAEDATGEAGELRIALDAEGRVTKWTLAPGKKR